MTRRRSDTVAIAISLSTIVLVLTILAYRVVEAQSQDSINATLFERTAALSGRLDEIQWYLRTTIAGVLGNLVANVLTLRSQTRRRGY